MLAASDAAKGLAERPSGLLRIALPRAVVPLIPEPILASFCQTYPDVTIEISANEELVDLAKGGFDAGVRMGQFIAEDMLTVRLSPPFRLIVDFHLRLTHFSIWRRPTMFAQVATFITAFDVWRLVSD